MRAVLLAAASASAAEAAATSATAATTFDNIGHKKKEKEIRNPHSSRGI